MSGLEPGRPGGGVRGFVVRHALALVVAAVALAAVVPALRWSARHPLGTFWDESEYTNREAQLVGEAQRHGVLETLRFARMTDRARPPAFRLAALPVAYAVGPDPRWLRALSLACLLLSAALVLAAARLLSGPGAALVAAAAFAFSLAPFWASAHFGTEYVLYLGIAALFYGLVRIAVRGGGAPLPALAAVAGGIALAALAKGTFLGIGVPAVLTFLALGRWAGLQASTVWKVAAAVLAGLLVAAWWYVPNLHDALHFARTSGAFVRDAGPWIPLAFNRLLGWPVAIGVLLLALALAARARRLRASLGRPEVLVLATCAAGVIPFAASHVLQANHLMRLLSPVLIPTAVAGAALAQLTGLAASRRAGAVAALALLLQGGLLARTFATSRIDQWDWTPLRVACDERGLLVPRIAHLGSGPTFNPPAIAQAWVLRSRAARVWWLWRYEDGPPDWDSVLASADSADVVVTAPGYQGDPADKQPLDNRHNAELASRLAALPAWDTPVELRLGPAGARVLAFFRRGAGSR